MALIDLDVEPIQSPINMIEQMATSNDWAFDRTAEDEITIGMGGQWADYHISMSWMPEIEALHVACSFDMKVPAVRMAETLRLLALINEQLWIGHFDVWEERGILIYRHALLLTGGASASPAQGEALLATAVESCERYFQAFQFAIWAGKTAREALDFTLFETAGEA